MSFKLLILFILSQFFLNQTVLAQCNGQKCLSGCKNCECTANNCKKSCTCPSTEIPRNLQLDETPQFIFMSFNGALSDHFYNQTRFIERLILNKNISDRNGCRIRPSFYITNDESDYKHISFFSKFGKIGLHSVTSKTNVQSNMSHWNAEFQVGKDLITKYSSINNNSIIMARPPNLYFNNNYYKLLKKYGIQIDSSIAENPYPSYRTWPYTLDWGYHNQNVCSGNDPLRECLSSFSDVEGIWEFVIPKFYDKENEGKTFDLTEINGDFDFEKAKKILRTNFLENYNTNRAPFGINVDPKWFLNYLKPDESKMQFVIDIYQWMGQHKNVLFADEEMIIKWMKNPTDFGITKSINDFVCPDDKENLKLESNACDPRSSNFCEDFNGRASYHICGNECPQVYPNIRNKTCGDNFCQLGIEDCNCADCKAFSPCHDSWPGWGRFRMLEKRFDEYSHYACGDIIFNNPTNKQAIEMIITLNVYQGEIILLEGGKKVELDVDERKEFWKIKKYKVKPYLMNQILSKTNYSRVSLCVKPETENFDDDFIQVGIQFFPSFFNATESFEKVNLSCGDGICTTEEKLLCNTDCSVSFEGLDGRHINIYLMMFALILNELVSY